MSGGIDGLGKARTAHVADTQRSQSARRSGEETKTNSDATLKEDSVALTDTLNNLRRLSQLMAAEPPMDQGRIASLRSSIADGNYVVDGNRTAQNFARLERELGGL